MAFKKKPKISNNQLDRFIISDEVYSLHPESQGIIDEFFSSITAKQKNNKPKLSRRQLEEIYTLIRLICPQKNKTTKYILCASCWDTHHDILMKYDCYEHEFVDASEYEFLMKDLFEWQAKEKTHEVVPEDV